MTINLQTESSPSPPTPSPFPLFPIGHLTLLLGLPGTGKSLLALNLAARLSLRSPLPPLPLSPDPLRQTPIDSLDFHLRPRLSFIFAKEDSDQTISLRLAVAVEGSPADTQSININPARASLLPPTEDERQSLPIKRTCGTCDLIDTCRDIAEYRKQFIGLIVLDPLPAFLEHFDAANNPALIRRVLLPLLEFAKSHNAAVLGINHLNKSHARFAIHRATGCNTYTALARSVLYLTHDPESPSRRILIPLKNNLATIDRAFAFHIRQQTEPASQSIQPYLEWEPEPITDDPHLLMGAQASAADITDLSPREEAISFLRTVLAEGPMPSTQLFREARSLCIPARTLQRALKDLGTRATRDRKRWYISQPEIEDDYSI